MKRDELKVHQRGRPDRNGRIATLCSKASTSNAERWVKLFAFRREDFFALALSLGDVERCVRLAKFFESSINRFERIVEVARLVVLVA